MHPRERVLGLARLAVMQGEPIPVDVIAQAEALGIYASTLGQPSTPTLEQLRAEKEKSIGNSIIKIHNAKGPSAVPLADGPGHKV